MLGWLMDESISIFQNSSVWFCNEIWVFERTVRAWYANIYKEHMKSVWTSNEKKKNIFKPTEANVIKFQSMEWEVNCVWFRNKIIALFSRMSSHSPWKQVNSGPAMFNLIWYVHISRSAIRFKITASIQIIKFSATLSKLS